MGKVGTFLFKINTFELFSKYGHYIFLKLHLMSSIKKWMEVTVFDFQGKFLLYPKWWVNVAFKFLNFPLNLFIRFVCNCTWWQTLRGGLKWLFWIFKKNSHFANSEANGEFLSQKSRIFNFSLDFSQIISESKD